MSKQDLAKQSEKLIAELEGIYLSGPWRRDREKVKRESEIKAELADIFHKTRSN